MCLGRQIRVVVCQTGLLFVACSAKCRLSTCAHIFFFFRNPSIQTFITFLAGPINPMDPELYQVFMNNNIFFSYAVDGRKIYKDLGGDKVPR